MLPLQPYHPGRYPPTGPKWVQFGDDILGGAVDDVRSTLERKKQWKQEYHLNRLQDEGMVPLSRRFASHRDPEEQATEAFDRPPAPPPPGPPPDHAPARERERQRRPEEEEGGYDTAEEGVVEQPSSSILTTISNGANSTLANMGAGLVHGTAYLAGAAAGAVGKGLVRGVRHLATGANPMEHHGGEEAASEAEEPLRPYPKAKARARETASSSSRQAPFPYPSRPFVDPSSYNGTGAHAFYIGDSEDDRSPPRAAAAAAAPARPSRPIAQRDVRLAQETMASLPANDYGRGRRRAPGRGG